MGTNQHPPCSRCGEPAALLRAVPRLGGLPELRAYRCDDCAVSFAVIHDEAATAPLGNRPKAVRLIRAA